MGTFQALFPGCRLRLKIIMNINPESAKSPNATSVRSVNPYGFSIRMDIRRRLAIVLVMGYRLHCHRRLHAMASEPGAQTPLTDAHANLPSVFRQ